MKQAKLRAMVLVWCEMHGCNRWIDLRCKARTEKGLLKQLRAGVKRGEWVAWRIITIEREEIGVCDE